MARLVGIDIRATQIRVALLRVRYRHVVLEHLLEASRDSASPPDAALQSLFTTLGQPIDGIAAALDGERAFIRRLKLPATAAKQLGEILPYELEAQVPVDLGELIYDYRLVRATGGEDLVALAAAARTEDISAVLVTLRQAVGYEPERVSCGALPLANLARVCAPLRVPGPIGIVDLGSTTSDVVVLANGEPIFARTISQGVMGLPDTAATLAARLRQSFAAAGDEPVQAVYLVGAGVDVPGAEAYLGYELGVPVAVLPQLELLGPAAGGPEMAARFAKALGIALALSGRTEDLDLRRGPLEFQRGYVFFKQKLPLMAGLLTAILISFLFATWAELRSLRREAEVLTAALGDLSGAVLGQRVVGAEEAAEVLSARLRVAEEDPMPHMDAYDVILHLSKSVPMDVTHDVEEFDFQRNKLRITGIVGTTGEAQRVSTALGEHECLKDTKIAKVTQVINSDRQKYVLESEVSCAVDQKKKSGTKETSR